MENAPPLKVSWPTIVYTSVDRAVNVDEEFAYEKEDGRSRGPYRTEKPSWHQVRGLCYMILSGLNGTV